MQLPARGLRNYPNDRHFPPGFLPISFRTSLTMLRSTNWFRSGSGFPCGQPSSGVVRDSKRPLIRLGGISRFYVNYKIACVFDDTLLTLRHPLPSTLVLPLLAVRSVRTWKRGRDSRLAPTYPRQLLAACCAPPPLHPTACGKLCPKSGWLDCYRC